MRGMSVNLGFSLQRIKDGEGQMAATDGVLAVKRVANEALSDVPVTLTFDGLFSFEDGGLFVQLSSPEGIKLIGNLEIQGATAADLLKKFHLPAPPRREKVPA